MKRSLNSVFCDLCTLRALLVILFINLPGWAVGNTKHATGETPALPSLMSRLEAAENTNDITAISALFSEDATIHVPDNMPFVGRETIISLFEFIWQQPDRKPTRYIIEGTRRTGAQVLEYGTSITSDQQGMDQATAFRAVIVESDRVSGDLAYGRASERHTSFVIRELVFGEPDKSALSLPAPTGEFAVGRVVRYQTGEDQPRGRPLSIELWYPASSTTADREVQHTRAVASASAVFLGMPPFMFSYSALVNSNAVRNTSPLNGKVFPVVLYNHGYGGFTSVYQTIFEELASHGYIVVSIGHVNESSLLIVDENTIMPSQPGNEVYASRASELQGQEINELQAIILGSDSPVELVGAYRKLVQLSPLHNESTRVWASDTHDVIAMLEKLHGSDSLLRGIFDLGNIGVMGHSVGGATAGQMAFGTPGIKAGVNIDGFQFGDLVYQRLSIPFMFVVSKQRGDSHLRALNFMADSKADAYQVVLQGFSHDSFSDLDFFRKAEGDRVGGPVSINLQRNLLRTFFDRYLKNMEGKLRVLADDHDEISITSYLR